jgi:hypothetical protein
MDIAQLSKHAGINPGIRSKTAPINCYFNIIWRRGRDSNPRYDFGIRRLFPYQFIGTSRARAADVNLR